MYMPLCCTQAWSCLSTLISYVVQLFPGGLPNYVYLERSSP